MLLTPLYLVHSWHHSLSIQIYTILQEKSTPLPSDALQAGGAGADAVVAMYHDVQMQVLGTRAKLCVAITEFCVSTS